MWTVGFRYSWWKMEMASWTELGGLWTAALGVA